MNVYLHKLQVSVWRKVPIQMEVCVVHQMDLAHSTECLCLKSLRPGLTLLLDWNELLHEHFVPVLSKVGWLLLSRLRLTYNRLGPQRCPSLNDALLRNLYKFLFLLICFNHNHLFLFILVLNTGFDLFDFLHHLLSLIVWGFRQARRLLSLNLIKSNLGDYFISSGL